MGKNLQIFLKKIISSKLKDLFAAVYTKPLCLLNVPVFCLPKIVFVGFMATWFLAASPISLSESVKAT